MCVCVFFRVCAPLCCKNLCCASRFCTGGGGAGGSRSKNLLEGAMKANARPGHNLMLPHPGPENQDSQHMLDQPRGSFPDLRYLIFWFFFLFGGVLGLYTKMYPPCPICQLFVAQFCQGKGPQVNNVGVFRVICPELFAPTLKASWLSFPA